MKQISKSLCEKIADQLTRDLLSKINKAKDDLREYNTQLYLSKIPLDVQSSWLSVDESYLNVREYTYFRSETGECSRVYLVKPVPHNGKETLVSTQEFEKYKSLENEITKLYQTRKTLSLKIEETLFSLKTPNRIKASFPEAYALIPTELLSPSTIPAICIKDLLEEINSHK